MSVGGDTINSGNNNSAQGGGTVGGNSKSKVMKYNKKSRTGTSNSYQLQQSSKKTNYPQAQTIMPNTLYAVADS